MTDCDEVFKRSKCISDLSEQNKYFWMNEKKIYNMDGIKALSFILGIYRYKIRYWGMQ